MAVEVVALDQPTAPAYRMPDRFRHDVCYFMAAPDEQGVPPLGPAEYWIHLHQAKTWLAEGVLYIISPLDSEHPAEVEISEEQEGWLEWLVAHGVQHVKIVDG